MAQFSSLPIIDSHHHLWKFDPVRDSWIDESMAVIQNDFLPVDLQAMVQEFGITGTVAVQADQSEAETAFLLDCASQNSTIRGIVGWVDLQKRDVEERLAYYSTANTIKGFRHVLQGEKQRDLMLQPAFVNGIRKLEQFNYTYDILIYPDQLQYAIELAAMFPNLKFVLDHLAKPYIKSGLIDEWRRQIKHLGHHDNVYCKVSGMVTEADRKKWREKDFTPYLDTVVEAFGTHKLMYGSDWPVCLLAASYGEVLKVAQNYFASFSIDEQQDIFYNNAVSFYNL